MKQPLLSPKRSRSSILPYLKQKRTKYVCIAVALLLAVAAVLSFIETDRNSFLPYLQNVEVLAQQGKLHVAVDETALDYVIHAEKCQRFCTSIDGKVAVFLTDTKELYLIREKQIKKIADDVLHFEIGSSGMGVAFAQKYAQQYALTYYDLKENTRSEITALLASLDFSISPDGQSLAYYTQMDGQDVLMCYRKNGEQVICREKSDLVGLSDDGKHIYAVCPKTSDTSALYAFNRRGKATELGTITSISCKFNEDHQQIMFYNNGKTMVSINGQPAVMASSYPLYLVTAPNSRSASDGNAITLPVSSLFDHVYTCSDGESTSAWLIRKDPAKSEKLVSKVSSCTLDASTKYLYYLHDLSQLYVMNISDGPAPSHLLAEEVDAYCVTSNRSKVYYTNGESLYCTNGKKGGNAKEISSITASYNLTMSASDVLYYLNGTDLYACKNGRKGSIAVEDVQSFYGSSNGVIYIISDNVIHTAYSKKQPAKILDAN